MKTTATNVAKLWMGDFARITCNTRTEFLCVIVNPSTRTLLSVSCGTEFNVALVIDGLEQARERENMPEGICFDGGIRRLPDYKALKEYTYKHGSSIRERSTEPAELAIKNIRQLVTGGMNCSVRELVDFYNSRLRFCTKTKPMQRAVSRFSKGGENA